ncbi:hypothetical protein V6N11_060230 [Hibiscus sabdariffa]|uniref:Uncharacterized protein n=1 Tax=Hibiscus sabdariffa TaxID=183260 RepID=A0ABR1ZDD4_9ROSI
MPSIDNCGFPQIKLADKQAALEKTQWEAMTSKQQNHTIWILSPYIDDGDDREMLKMEEARQAYLVALAATKEKQDEESFAAAASARLYLQSFLFRSENAE